MKIFSHRFPGLIFTALFACSFALSSCASTPAPPISALVEFQPDMPLALSKAPLHVFVVGDTGSKTAQQLQVAESLARQADKIKAASLLNPVRAVIFVGDNFYENGVKDADDPLWQSAFEEVYDPKRLPMPFFAALGNHDWMTNPQAQMDYPKRHKTRWQMDNFWYRRQYSLAGDTRPLADLFFIDSDLWLRSEEKVKPLAIQQSAWLEAQLKNSKARWKFVFAHHPLYSDGGHGHSEEIRIMREHLSTLLEKYRVDAYLCGHDHDLQRIEVPEVKTLFLVSGAGGKLRPRAFNDHGPFYASKAGFLSLTISPEQMKGEFLDADGKTLDSFTRAPLMP
jgi:tartrate-resistant acid phosphatase type 5